MLAYAIVQNDNVLVGSLMPGSGASSEEVSIPPGFISSFTVEWDTGTTSLSPGIYQVYAVLAASQDYPEYFGGGSSELNDTLYDKLIPAEIELLP